MSCLRSPGVPPSSTYSAAVVAAMYFAKRSPDAPRFGLACTTAMGAARLTRLRTFSSGGAAVGSAGAGFGRGRFFGFGRHTRSTSSSGASSGTAAAR